MSTRAYDTGLERALTALRDDLSFPPTPNLALGVRGLIAVRDLAPRARPLLGRRGIAYAAVAAIVLVATLVSVSPQARHAVAGWLGLRGVRIGTTNDPLPSARPLDRSPGSLGKSLGLGDLVTLDEVAASAGFDPLLPRVPELGAPDEVYIGTSHIHGQISLVYGARPGYPQASTTGAALLLTQFEARIGQPLLGKLVDQGARIDALEVNGGRAFWIRGEHTVYFYEDPGTGQVIESIPRLAGNTLLWESGGITLRLESALSQEAALRVAESVR